LETITLTVNDKRSESKCLTYPRYARAAMEMNWW